MYSCIILLLTIIPNAFLQVTQNISATGAIPGGSASGQGVGIGANVQGTVEVSVDKSASRSSVVLSASDSSPSNNSSPPKVLKPYPFPKPTQYKTPVAVPQKVYTRPHPVCEDIKDDKCYGIHQYKNCGFCVQSKYPTKGYGCSYTEEVVLKNKGDNKKEYEYETKVVPKCDCDGIYILDKNACPSCDQ
eukprot:TRINITY_DN9973_c0_g2_i3.p1 TRINITY_DN9973_c0_g2~~TRINITY_DN9973_c0_g2_i3.p1  ORF type:complete len:189 (+),score=10.08 TRINITY_DN9973_c0_g2_i3:90-656(+)